MNHLFQKLRERSGQGLTEYLILLLVVSIACIGASRKLGVAINERIERAKGEVSELRDTHTAKGK